jgi:hypothetical protein
MVSKGQLAVVGLFVVVNAVAVTAVSDFPPPPMPHRPHGWKIYCDVCDKMMSRVVPFCQREEQNMDYLTDFCTYNYNSVLRPECDYITNVMDYVWCPNACSQVRKHMFMTNEKICHHHLVNCTERNPFPSPVPSPSPSPSMPLSPDCALCEYTIKNVAEMCMNEETANKKNTYQVCMTKTTNTRDFDSCTGFLGELVALAGTRDPCEMLSCEEPKVTCKQFEDLSCHVVEYNKEDAENKGVLGLDENGNIIKPSPPENPIPFHKKVAGLGPSDFMPGQAPFHEENHHNTAGARMSVLYPDVKHPSYSLNHIDNAEVEVELANVTMS